MPVKKDGEAKPKRSRAVARSLPAYDPRSDQAENQVLVMGRNGDAHAYAARSRLPPALKGIQSSAGSLFGIYGLKFMPVPYNPDDLVQRKGIRIYREMANDEQAKAALFAKKYAVLSNGYEIQAAETPESGSDELTQEYKDFIEFNLNEMKGSFESKLLDILSATAYGFSVTEKIFTVLDYGPFEGKWGLRDLKTRPPDDIQFSIDSAGDLLEDGIIQGLEKLPADKFIVYSHNGTFGNHYGESDLRAAYRAYWCKLNMMKLMAVALERYGEPIAVATVKGVIDDITHNDLESFLKNLQSRSGIILPEQVILDFKAPPPRAAEAFIPALNYYDQLIRVAIMMPGLMGLSGEQQTGSLARSVTEFDVFLWVLSQIRRDIETCVNEQLVKPLLDLNYEIEHGFYPRFRFKEVTEEARYRQFEMYLMGLSGAALTKGPDDEDKLRELINFEPLPEGFEPPETLEDVQMEMMKKQAEQPMMMPPGANGNGGGPPQFGKGPPKAGAKPPVPGGQTKKLSFDQDTDEQVLLAYIEQMRRDYNAQS